ncbi:acyl-CoA dehydrogenase [Zoogloea sp.]|jgi:alkylation response protein AidB-like acyl-CoA dehydrogenase|uniref:acyl-CoA dehydrogenase n=1 Tax=Zoogloea sp. TaxID=49181 RepID=UPI0011D44BE3|nr:acyl-CoA dehydrogenase [Zoogloea sp.]MBK6656520.1 acyl-CoA dehydrogenase [Zoogloea sp.]TXG87118.1 MAG: acyl-CoA dehydrogenase [Zoogloea sp.]HOY01417.1 acyl-CoA dehydrogenase [Zoogloea sp.]HPI61275.1 acyl-CoA dehydrogenase [Zoogloea sp.]
MSAYTAPLQDMHFVLNELAGLEQISALPGCEEATAETVTAVLHEAGKFSSGVLAPLNRPGDVAGCRWEDGDVKTPAGFVEAYQQFVEGGWNGLNFPCEFGGQGLPKLVASPVLEMVMSANLGFSLCPLLTGGAIEALLLRGTPEQKATYLHRMVEGSWTGTMNLTEPQAGSDLGLIRSKAVPDGDHYRIYGQKIFITHGEHDMAENIIHLVLARLPDAPEGVKGISLFVVPKFLVNPDGSLGARNDVRCVSIEHKLGIHASPTAVLSYGDREGAIGYLVGEENRGVEYMFVMMNEARYTVGLQGVAVSERAYQLARSYAADRVQSKDLADPRGPSVAIIHHPDVRRMLMTMRALAEATRAVAYVVGAAIDQAHLAPDDAARQEARAFVDYMIPIHKGWATEASIEVANLGIQVHGGMGFIEETGAAQYLRDARITTIYEGTTGIQANDLVGRKTAREGGSTARALIARMQATVDGIDPVDADMAIIRDALARGIQDYTACVEWIVATYGSDIRAVHAGAVPFLKLAGIVCGGWQLARAADIATRRLAEAGSDRDFLSAKVITARFYAEHLMSRVAGLRQTMIHGAGSTMALPVERF